MVLLMFLLSDLGPRFHGVEAEAGIEPANGSFADFCLTTWLLRRLRGAETRAGGGAVNGPGGRN